MNTHMSTVHGSEIKRTGKRLYNFTPIAKTSKRGKNTLINSEGLIEATSSPICKNGLERDCCKSSRF